MKIIEVQFPGAGNKKVESVGRNGKYGIRLALAQVRFQRAEDPHHRKRGKINGNHDKTAFAECVDKLVDYVAPDNSREQLDLCRLPTLLAPYDMPVVIRRVKADRRRHLDIKLCRFGKTVLCRFGKENCLTVNVAAGN